MNILEEIIAHKTKEVQDLKATTPTMVLEKSLYFNTPVVSLAKYLRRTDKLGVIAEIKRKSPSKGMLNEFVDVEQTSIGYMQGGATALSVLTDKKYFGGMAKDLEVARKYNFCPILRKDFIVDEFQIIEAKSIGADAILLIAAALAPETLKSLARFAYNLGLEVFLEITSLEELEATLCEHIAVIGVNNRDLTNMTTSLEQSAALINHLPTHLPKVAESGIHSAADLVSLKKMGFDGFLMGTTFMQHPDPHVACKQLIDEALNLTRV